MYLNWWTTGVAMSQGRDGGEYRGKGSTPHNERVQQLLNAHSWVSSKHRCDRDCHVGGDELELAVASLALGMSLGLLRFLGNFRLLQFLLWVAILRRVCLPF